jgi:hypothetical protein
MLTGDPISLAAIDLGRAAERIITAGQLKVGAERAAVSGDPGSLSAVSARTTREAQNNGV